MAAKTKYQRLESEIDRCRVDALWGKAVELSRQLSSKSQGLDFYVSFTIGESKLEEYIRENAPIEKNISKAKAHLGDAENLLTQVARDKNKLSLEAELLLAKVHFCKGAYEQCLATFDKARIDDISKEISSVRLLQLLAESYAMKGISTEKLGPTSSSKYRVTEHEEKIINCFEKAGNLAMLYLQERERSVNQNSAGVSPSPTPSNSQDEDLGIILETAIQQSPILYIKRGELSKGVNRFRELLRVVESRFTQCLRQTLARQLAEVLLRGMCEKTYIPLGPVKSPRSSTRLNTLQPRKYSGERLFVPQDENEEALLLLLIAEAIATREAVLNRTEELDEARTHSFMNSTAVYDLLAIALVKRAQFNKLSDSFERAMRFSYEEFHVWHQFANSLICAEKYSRALVVLKECTRLKPKNYVVRLQAARLCFEYLHQYDEGIRLVEQVADISTDHPMAARIYIALGIGYSLKAMQKRLQADRQELHKKALDSFTRAHTLDPSDYLALFHLSLQLAIHRQIGDAIKYVRLALRYRSDHIHSLHLLVLLLTANKQYEEAAELLNAALEEYPENLSLMLTKSKLEEILFGPEQALTTCKHMLKLWKDLYEVDTEDSATDTRSRQPAATDRSTFDRRSFAQLQLSELNDRDTGSLRAESVAASRVEQTLSEVASSMNSTFQPRHGSQQTWLLQAQIWLHLADLYLTLDKISEAEACVQETSSIFPLSHQVAFMKGRLFEHKLRFSEAKGCYENAVAINPGHTKSLQHLGMVLHQLDNDQMAEKVLRDAVNTDPVCHQSWYLLGLVLESLQQVEAASECHTTTLELEATSPVVPFTVIPRMLQ